MTDPNAVVGAGLAILGSKDVLTKILGPSADYLGGQAAGLIQKCNINLDHIFSVAFHKLGKRIDQPGSVSPRILRHIVDDGRFCEDELVSEYYGGLLAASRTSTGKDDRGLPFLARIKEMSVYQIRLHFVIYYTLLKHLQQSKLNIGVQTDREKMRIFVPYSGLRPALKLEPTDSFDTIFYHAINGLFVPGLTSGFAYGNVEHLQTICKDVTESGFIVTPTYFGAELFLWAIGTPDPNAHMFFQKLISEVKTPIEIPIAARVIEP